MALRYFTNAIKKRCTAFIISDFIDNKPFSDALTIANRKHDLVALQVYDKRDAELPPVGLIKVKDAETDERMWIDTNDRRLRMSYKNNWEENRLKLQHLVRKANIDSVSVEANDDYVRSLMQLFRMRQ